MAFTRPPFASSISHAGSSSSENVPFDNRGPRNSAPAALQPLVSSASALPGQNRQSTSGASGSLEQVVEQSRSFRVSQQKLHDEERRHWEKERKELHNRIHQLEETVSSLLYNNGSLSPPTSGGWAASGFGTFPTQPPYRPPTPTSTGREVWRGPETRATRTFSDSSETSSKATASGRLASIPEKSELIERKKSVEFAQEDGKRRGSSIPGSLIHPNYDGINLKTNLLPPETTRPMVDSPSPLHSPSPRTNPTTPPSKPISEPKPKLIDVPRTRLNSEALYTQDAGHTPLAQVTGEDSQLPSAIASPTLKPVDIPVEVEQPPYEPLPSVRPPNERADSYFPVADSVDVTDATTTNEEQKENINLPDAPADDPALKGPLSLSSSNTRSGDMSFLDKVNSELEHQVTAGNSRHFSLDGSSEAGLEGNDKEKGKELEREMERNREQRDKGRGMEGARRDRSDSEAGEDSDGGPKLRLKSSMNFGAPLGKGF